MTRACWHHFCYLLIALIIVLSVFDSCFALKPQEVLVVANKNVSASIDLAGYYMKKRKIPKQNLCLVSVTGKETISRIEYKTKIARPVANYLKRYDKKRKIRCLLLIYGLPLKIAPPESSAKDKDDISGLIKKQHILEELIEPREDKKEDIIAKIKKELKNIKKIIQRLRQADKLASLDSEIALVLENYYPLAGWLKNPYFIGFGNKQLLIDKKNVLMVSRLDAPSETIVKRIIDDSIKAEATGLQGTAYFDARWPYPKKKKLSLYEEYDKSIHKAAKTVKSSKLLPVVKDETNELFRKGACPAAALYCGWYSHAKYIDSFTWLPGSVGYHIASSECTTLKTKSSRVWCKMMLENGIAATIGPVGEPYVNAFPVPDIFFGLLTDGYLTLAECYIVSTPFVSWKMVLIGDPLYKPFMTRRYR